MFKQISWSKIGTPYNYAEYLCETDADISSLPTQIGKCAIGSKAFVLSTGKTYILNNSNQWIQYNGSSSSVGADSYIPVRGVDYWTEADKTEMQQYVDSIICPGDFKVTATLTVGIDPDTGDEIYGVTVDKTYAEIVAAAEAGKRVYAAGTAALDDGVLLSLYAPLSQILTMYGADSVAIFTCVTSNFLLVQSVIVYQIFVRSDGTAELVNI